MSATVTAKAKQKREQLQQMREMELQQMREMKQMERLNFKCSSINAVRSIVFICSHVVFNAVSQCQYPIVYVRFNCYVRNVFQHAPRNNDPRHASSTCAYFSGVRTVKSFPITVLKETIESLFSDNINKELKLYARLSHFF